MKNWIKVVVLFGLLCEVRSVRAEIGFWSVVAVYFVVNGIVEICKNGVPCVYCKKQSTTHLYMCLSCKKKYQKKLLELQRYNKNTYQKELFVLVNDYGIDKKKIEKELTV